MSKSLGQIAYEACYEGQKTNWDNASQLSWDRVAEAVQRAVMATVAPEPGHIPLSAAPLEHIHAELSRRFPLGFIMAWSYQHPAVPNRQAQIEEKTVAFGTTAQRLGLARHATLAIERALTWS